MGQHAAVAGAGAPVEVADVAAQEEPVAVEAAVEEEGAIVGKDCPAGCRGGRRRGGGRH